MNESRGKVSAAAERSESDASTSFDTQAKSAAEASKNVRADRARVASSEAPFCITLDVFAELIVAARHGDASVVDRSLVDRFLKRRDELVLPVDGAPCQWRKLGTELKTKYLQLAIHDTRGWAPSALEWVEHLVAQGRAEGLDYAAYTFDLRLSKVVQTQALTFKHGATDYIHRRLRRHLPAKRTPYWFAIEFAPSGGWLHVHGTIGCEQGALDDLRARLLRVGGEFPAEFKPFALRMRLLGSTPDGFRRASYAVKEAADTRQRLGHAPVAALRQVNRAARTLHAKHRELLLNDCNGRKLGGAVQ